MSDKNRRNFILKEVQKRIIGPGYTEETYVCKDNAYDEILDNRSQRVYSAGILFPQASISLEDEANEQADEIKTEENNAEIVSDEITNISQTIADENFDTDTDGSVHSEELPATEDSNHFSPNHIGLIACLNSSVNEVEVELNYGQYHHVRAEDFEKEIHVRFGRCTVQQIRETFEYYDKYAQATLKSIGKNSVSEIFSIDEEHGWVSPKGVFEIGIEQKDGSVKKRNLRPNDFPSLLQNKAATVLIDVLERPTIAKSIIDIISWEDLKVQLEKFNYKPVIKQLLRNNGYNYFEEVLKYDQNNQTIKVHKGIFKIDENLNLRDFLYVDDPVRSYLLDKLLRPIFFKREQKTFSCSISLLGESSVENDDAKLVWKIIPSRYNQNIKYLRILVANKHKFDGLAKYEDFLHQMELKVISQDICSYTEPHLSAIADEEYELNEVLYSDELVYAKGVNCAATWEQTEHPNWVKTTYVPQKDVRSFATSSENEDVNRACCIHDMTIWSKVTKKDLLYRFRKMASAYATWQKEQKGLAEANLSVLKSVIDNQKEFKERLNHNIDYLEKNERAFNCFLLANTAMYIQMVLSRDKEFSPKGRKPEDYNTETLLFKEGAWDYYSDNRTTLTPKPTYRPFQLAFLLMNVEPTFEKDVPSRNDIVDLIWFPTGGGKTEAYLALTAFTIAERRTSGEENVRGVSVIMRYTLRLLTSQQFERASFLICSLEFLRKELINRQNFKFSLGTEPITIGMWIGKASTPNFKRDLKKGYFKLFFDTINGDKSKKIDPKVPQSNPFPVSYCPWCGCNLVGSVGTSILKGYDENNGNLICIMHDCYFNNSLPIDYVDEKLYASPPTLLFATVDKFAQLTTKTAGKLLGVGTKQRKPDLIIQDELHLISDTLGSIVGMFETMVEELCIERDSDGNIVRRPKIIASTATTRNTKNLIKQLYNREVKSFPVSGVRYTDNFFSHVVPQENSKRLYAGFSPTGHTSAELEIRMIAAELVVKEMMIRNYLIDKDVNLMDKNAVLNQLFCDNKLKEELDRYWTLVIYYKDMKTLGRTHSRIGQEVEASVRTMRSFIQSYSSLDFILKDFPQRLNEFTSRQDSSRIKQLLNDATSPTLLYQSANGSLRIASKMDIVQATNMISVGIDIDRWNVMIVNGQPMKTAEYIQASSRVGRTYDGLIINLLNPMRTRELSIYENYEAYHQVFYKYVEPLSATTFTEMTLQKLMANLYFSFMVLVRKKDKPSDINEVDIDAFKSLLTSRCKSIGTYEKFILYMSNSIDKINNYFQHPTRVNRYFFDIQQDTDIMNELQEKLSFTLMRSLREVESNSFVLYE